MFDRQPWIPLQTRASHSKDKNWNLRWMLRLLVLGGLAFLPACRQAAFNEYYVENMAAEIRALEDRIYEYDSAYQSLEIENEDLRAKCERLRSKLQNLESGKSSSQSNSAPVPLIQSYEMAPNVVIEPTESFELVPRSSTTETPPPIVPATPASPPNIESQLKDKTKTDLPEVVVPKSGNESVLPFPANNPNTTKSRSSDTRELVEEFTLPQGLIRSAQQPVLKETKSQDLPAARGTKPFPSALPTLPNGDKPSIIQGRINLPASNMVVPASAELPVKSRPEEAIDTRIVEIGFHPTLCRGHNFDDRPGDDGLYLVIVPRNEKGQAINQEGKLTIVAEEQIEGQPSRVAAWELTSSQLKEFLEPIGISQGYHVRLPWQGKAPVGRVLQVFLKYELDPDRVLVNRSEIVLSKPSNRQLTWTPR